MLGKENSGEWGSFLGYGKVLSFVLGGDMCKHSSRIIHCIHVSGTLLYTFYDLQCLKE